FGNVNVGSTKQLTFTIGNSGNSTMTVSSITYPAGFTGNWSGGTIAASGSRTVTVTFTPTAAQTYGGTVTVNSDKTSGTNTLQISGTGTGLPTASLSLSSSAFSENGGTTKVTATLDRTSSSQVIVSLSFAGNAQSGTDYKASAQSITIPSGQLSGSITLTGIADSLTEGNETVIVSIGGGVLLGQPPSVTATITDSTVSNYTISGYVRDATSTGMSSITLTFSNSGGTATTNTSGFYTKTVSSGWTGMVTPSKSGYTFTPATRSYSSLTANQTNQNYTGGVPPAAFRIWIDKNGSGVYDAGEEVIGASVRVNNETTDRGITDSQGIIAIPNIANDAKIYAQKTLYSMNNPKAGDANFASTRSKNPYYAGSLNGKMYDFVMASDIMAADGTYADFPGQGKTSLNAAKDTQGNMLIRLVHPKIGWNIVVSFEEAQSTVFYDKIKSGFRSYADYMYNYTDGYFVVKNVVLVKGAYLNSAQWNYSDVQVRNSEWPNAHIFGNRYNWQTRISMGKDWGGALPDGYNWYSTLGHESGHYLLGFYDEYLSGSKKKVSDGTWTYRISHDGDTGEPKEFPKNYGLMESQYNGIHEMSDPTEYFPHNYSSADIVTNQFYLRTGQSCWTYFKSYYQNDIKTQMAGQGFSDAFFNGLIIPPHSTGSYPGSDRTKRNGPSVMNRDTVTFIEWNYPTARSTRQNENVFDADAVVLDETGTPVDGADVWLLSSDRKSFREIRQKRRCEMRQSADRQASGGLSQRQKS
ncbi:MAG: choice-of-anchor D domain-containing protein, partial [Desulfobacteraceae bacterium]|nr:choice-of-anchor D domain-containing protein [Desulfobacteraceae bacterium]